MLQKYSSSILFVGVELVYVASTDEVLAQTHKSVTETFASYKILLEY